MMNKLLLLLLILLVSSCNAGGYSGRGKKNGKKNDKKDKMGKKMTATPRPVPTRSPVMVPTPAPVQPVALPTPQPVSPTPFPSAMPVVPPTPPLIPTPFPSAMPVAPVGPGTIVDVAIEAGFDTLVAAVVAADLVETLSGDGPFTVFAPTDEAFAALPDGTLESLLADPSGALTNVLLYHVVSGMVMAAELMTGPVTTVGGGDIMVEASDMGVILNGDVTIIVADIVASNGVIHVIDAVLIP